MTIGMDLHAQEYECKYCYCQPREQWFKWILPGSPEPENMQHEGYEDKILEKGLPVGQDNGISKAPAVRHRVCECQDKGYNGEKRHEYQHGPHSQVVSESEKQGNPNDKFHCCKGDCQHQGEWFQKSKIESIEIICELVGRSQRIDPFNKATENEDNSEN